MRLLRRWWHRLRGWWVLAVAAATTTALSAVAQPYSGMAAAALCVAGLAVLGVHKAPALGGNQVPPFVPRDLLPDLVAALVACLPHHVCVCPDSQDTLHEALTAAKVNRPSVLWLDDLEIRRSHISALESDGRLDEATALVEQLAQDTERVLGADHPTTADVRSEGRPAQRPQGMIGA